MIYVDLTGLCDRKWTGVEKYADTLFSMLIRRFGVQNVVGLKVGLKSEEGSLFLGKNRGRIVTEYFYLPRFIKQHPQDTVIFPVFPPSERCWRYSKKLIPVIHDAVPWKFQHTLSLKARLVIVPRMKKALKSAKKIITVSETAKKELTALNPTADVVVIYNAFGLVQKKDIFDRLKIEKKQYLLSVSTLEPRKNFPYLLKVADILFDFFPDVKLVIVGRIGWGKISYVPRHKDNFVFTGYISDEDLQRLYREAKLFVTLPIDEGFGRTPVEAALHKIPVAVSDIPIFHEVLGVECFYLPLGDERKCAFLLEKYLRCKSLKTPKLSFFDRFSVDVVSEQIPDDLFVF